VVRLLSRDISGVQWNKWGTGLIWPIKLDQNPRLPHISVFREKEPTPTAYRVGPTEEVTLPCQP
jgi:hypothetical protein